VDVVLRWVRGYLAAAFLGGPEGRRRVMFLLFVGLVPVTVASSFVFAGGHHTTLLFLRGVGFATLLAWLVARRRPSNAEWVAMWTVIALAWTSVQYAVGPAYAGVFSMIGVAVFVAATVAFDRFIIGYVFAAGTCGYAVVELHFHPAGRALLAVLLLLMVGALVVVIVGGTASFLRESLRDVNVLHSRMAEATDLERARIAGALHDDTVQALTAAALKQDGLIRRLQRGEAAGAEDAALQVRDMIQGASERTRRLSFDLYPMQLGDRGLGPAIDALGAQAAGNEGPEVVVDAPNARYPAEVERLAYRTIRELLQNARKHAKATRVVVSVAAETGALRCSVADDGRGFDAATWDNARQGLHMGLDTTAERVRMAGGEFVIESEPGHGTRVSFSLPIHQAQAPQAIVPDERLNT
jgi:signal transduction histidine kinase